MTMPRVVRAKSESHKSKPPDPRHLRTCVDVEPGHCMTAVQQMFGAADVFDNSPQNRSAVWSGHLGDGYRPIAQHVHIAPHLVIIPAVDHRLGDRHTYGSVRQ